MMKRLEELRNEESSLYFAYMECSDPNNSRYLRNKLRKVREEIEELEKQEK